MLLLILLFLFQQNFPMISAANQPMQPQFLPGAQQILNHHIGGTQGQAHQRNQMSSQEESQRIVPFGHSLVRQVPNPTATGGGINGHEDEEDATIYQSLIGHGSSAADGTPKSEENGTGGRRSAADAGEMITKRRPEIFNVPRDRFTPVRAVLKLKLRRYYNPSRGMQNQTTCACENASQCPQDGKSNHNPCYFAFAAVASTTEQLVDYRFTPFVVVDRTGIIDAQKESEWGAQMEFTLTSKPQNIEIYAFNLGPVFRLDGRVVSWAETIWPVDAWTIDLSQFLPYGTYEPVMGMEQRETVGRYVNSVLNLEYSVQCQNHNMGPNCDLKCEAKSSADEQQRAKLYGGINQLTNEIRPPAQQRPRRDTIICHSDLEGNQKHFFECQYNAQHQNNQVENCKFCEYGVINESVCVHDPARWKEEPGVDELYRTFTIILAVALGILLVLLVVTCIFCWILCRRQSSGGKVRREAAPPLGTYRRGTGAPYNISENGIGMGNNNRGQMGDWSKPAQAPAAVQRGILVHPHQAMMSPHGHGGASILHSPHAHQLTGEFGPMATSSPNTSESEDYRPSPFTSRREAQV